MPLCTRDQSRALLLRYLSRANFQEHEGERERHTHPLLRAREQERRRVNGKRHLKSPLRHYHAQFDPFSGGRSRGRIHSCRRCPEIRARVQLFSSFEKGGKKKKRPRAYYRLSLSTWCAVYVGPVAASARAIMEECVIDNHRERGEKERFGDNKTCAFVCMCV